MPPYQQAATLSGCPLDPAGFRHDPRISKAQAPKVIGKRHARQQRRRTRPAPHPQRNLIVQLEMQGRYRYPGSFQNFDVRVQDQIVLKRATERRVAACRVDGKARRQMRFHASSASKARGPPHRIPAQDSPRSQAVSTSIRASAALTPSAPRCRTDSSTRSTSSSIRIQHHRLPTQLGRLRPLRRRCAALFFLGQQLATVVFDRVLRVFQRVPGQQQHGGLFAAHAQTRRRPASSARPASPHEAGSQPMPSAPISGLGEGESPAR